MATRRIERLIGGVVLLLVMSGCTAPPPVPRGDSVGHLNPTPPVKAQSNIPAPVKRRAFVPVPKPEPPKETFTVVVNEVPVRELLFALARDASINVDIHPDITGNITLNAVDQTLEQILDRFAGQLSLRYEQRGKTTVVLPDNPILDTYKVDYVNVSRDSIGKVSASTLVASGGGGGGGGNTSQTDISSVSSNHFWDSLEAALDEIVNPTNPEAANVNASLKRVISNRETGLILVRATAAQHKQVRRYIDQVMVRANRQVLIEATIVEVQLNDRYQAGINWQLFTRQGGLLGAGINIGTNVATAFTAGASSAVTGLILNAADAPTGSAKRTIQTSISLLNEFGDTKVLSSPKIMALNNQPAALKVVDNEVYFEIATEIDPGNPLLGTAATVSFDTDARTVSVGLVMSVVPQISESGEVTMHIRPTITRVREFVDDPAVPIALAQAGVTNINVKNSVPVIQVRESETVMRVGTGQIAVLGGLMQDTVTKDDESVPGLSEIGVFGELFNFRDRQQIKSELVIFLRPTVIKNASVNADLAEFAPYLPQNLPSFERQKIPFKPVDGLDQ